MIGLSTIIAVCITLCITLFLPIVVYIIYGIKSKEKGVWLAWIIGALGFLAMQMGIRLPILSAVALLPSFSTFVTNHFVLYSFILAVTAALFEVIGRYGVARILNKKGLSPKMAVAAGLGHGGIESIVLIGMTYVSNLILILMINSGGFDIMIHEAAAAGVDMAQLAGIKDTMLNTDTILFYLAGYERVLTMIIHLAMSLLVCYGVWKGKALPYVTFSFLFHWALDFFIPLLNALSTPYLGSRISATASYVLVYGVMTILAAVAAVLIGKTYKKFDPHSPAI